MSIGKYLSSSFSIENGLKQEDALQPIIPNIPLEYIRKLQESNLGLDMNSTHQLLNYAEYVNLISDNIRGLKRNVDELLNN